MPKSQKPSPVVVTTICSLCDEPWEAHGDNPTAEDCVRLLKAKIAAMPVAPIVIDRRVPYPSPYPVYPRPWQRPTWIVGSGMTTYRTPNTCVAISATSRAA